MTRQEAMKQEKNKKRKKRKLWYNRILTILNIHKRKYALSMYNSYLCMRKHNGIFPAS